MRASQAIPRQDLFQGYTAPVQSTVLLVGMRPEAREILRASLESCGYHVVTAGTAKEAARVRHRRAPESLGAIIIAARAADDPLASPEARLYQRWRMADPEQPMLFLKASSDHKGEAAGRSHPRHALEPAVSQEDMLDTVWAMLRDTTEQSMAHRHSMALPPFGSVEYR